MPKNVSIPMLARAAAVMPQSVNEDQRTVEVTFTTGALVRRFDWLEGEYEEELVVSENAMRMDRLRNGAPLLADHESYEIDSVLGVVERAWVDGGEGRALVRFAKDEETETVWQKVKDGILRNISVGYIVHAYQEIKEGARRILRAVDWEPMEISLVAVPADAGSQIRSAAKSFTAQCIVHRAANSQAKEEIMEPETIEGGADTTVGAAAEDTVQGAATDAGASDDTVAGAAADAPASGERAAEIMELCALANQPLQRALEFVREGKTPAQVRAALMQARDQKIAGEAEIASHVTPPAEQKTGGTAKRMQETVAKRADKAQGGGLVSRMQRRFSA